MPYWIQLVVFALISGFIQYLISYSKEKGRNLATKEDIKEITEKVEQVKENYNKSLETHKAELQKGLDSHRYIIGMCHDLDGKLIKLMTECINIEASKGIEETPDDTELKYKVVELDKFLTIYNERYNKKLHNLIAITSGIHSNVIVYEEVGDYYDPAGWELKQWFKEPLMEKLHKGLSLFLPKL